MTTKALHKLAASTIILGMTMVSCGPNSAQQGIRTVSQATTPVEKSALAAAFAGQKALDAGKLDKAVAEAERAVGLQPRDAGYRNLLANAYLKSGRFASAEAGFADVLTLNPGNERAVLSLALSQIAQNKKAAARDTLARVKETAAPADIGLAMALAGDTGGAIVLLMEAARLPEADGRLRQNLALAYALNGQWAEARTIAAQDISAAELPDRIGQWATFVHQQDQAAQIATILGVTPRTDGGRPERLALASAAPVALAEAAPTVELPVSVEVAQPTPAETVQAPIADEIFAEAAPMPEPAPQPEPVREVPAAIVAARSIEAVLPKAIARPVARAVKASLAAPRFVRGRYVVQLGAFGSAARAEQAWAGAVRRHAKLGAYIPAGTLFNTPGGALTRLSVGGFATAQGAQRLCASYRRSGGTCFVRATAGDAPPRWALRRTQRANG